MSDAIKTHPFDSRELIQAHAQVTPRKRRSTKAGLLPSAVIAKFTAGQSKSQIANDLGIHRNTVASILSDSEIQQYVLAGRSDCVQMIPKSVRVIGERLKKGSEAAALAILRGTQVLQNQPIATTTNNIQANTWIMMKAQAAGERTLDTQALNVSTETSDDPAGK